ncbi:hypothetical protein ZHAS_00007328 [Anopheles sinensis]|uniref:Uncharacterized protein n=1 Tax=Anopheles sinensis TaxID=74873 RepID=A0A084VPQ1_ANOSI|nr:hypothetical protein ZHAS_00007328 [Anopheles sinensis]
MNVPYVPVPSKPRQLVIVFVVASKRGTHSYRKAFAGFQAFGAAVPANNSVQCGCTRKATTATEATNTQRTTRVSRTAVTLPAMLVKRGVGFSLVSYDGNWSAGWLDGSKGERIPPVQSTNCTTVYS